MKKRRMRFMPSVKEYLKLLFWVVKRKRATPGRVFSFTLDSGVDLKILREARKKGFEVSVFSKRIPGPYDIAAYEMTIEKRIPASANRLRPRT